MGGGKVDGRGVSGGMGRMGRRMGRVMDILWVMRESFRYCREGKGKEGVLALKGR